MTNVKATNVKGMTKWRNLQTEGNPAALRDAKEIADENRWLRSKTRLRTGYCPAIPPGLPGKLQLLERVGGAGDDGDGGGSFQEKDFCLAVVQ